MNYKGKVRSITIAGIEMSVPAGAIIKHLYEQTGSSSAADGMFDQDDLAVYAVPAGKQFHLLGVKLHLDETLTGGTLVLSTGDTEDAETATITSIDIATMKNVVQEIWINDKIWAATKFITINPASAVIEYTEMIGYEL